MAGEEPVRDAVCLGILSGSMFLSGRTALVPCADRNSPYVVAVLALRRLLWNRWFDRGLHINHEKETVGVDIRRSRAD